MKRPIEGQMKEIYEFICVYIAVFGQPPRREELKNHFKIAQSTLARILEVLEFRGYLIIAKSASRGIKVVDGGAA